MRKMITSFTSTQAPLYQELYLPGVLFLVCPAERRGSWFRQTGDDSVYECSCGARWNIFPEDRREMDEI